MSRELRPYSKYKDSGVEWIGEVPEEWEIIKLKYLAIDKNSLFMDGNWIESNIIGDKGVCYITTGNIGNGKFKERTKSYISVEIFNALNCLKALPGDIAISRLNEPIGRSCILTNDEAYYVVAVDIVVFRPDYNYDKDYLNYCMNTTRYNEHGAVLARGTTMKRISRTALGNFYFPIPGLNEQNLISKYLNQKTSEIDALIADKEKLITLLEEKRQAVITETVTKGLDPNFKMKDSGIEWMGEIPEHWELSKIKYHAKLNVSTLSDSTNPVRKIEYIDIGSVDSNGNILSKESMKFKTAPSRARRVVKSGDTIVSTVRTYLQAITMIDSLSDGSIVSTGFAVLTPKHSVVNEYFGYYFRSKPVLDRIISISKGVNYPAITSNELINLHFIYPPYKEQLKITKKIEDITRENEATINIINNQISKLKEYRESLIYEAVTGKIDLRNYGEESELLVAERGEPYGN